MTKGLVTCRKCGKTFNYDTHDGVCPKCCRYYSLTKYNEEEALLNNILAPANEENCSYHGGHDRSEGLSGHSESIHSMDKKTTYTAPSNTSYTRGNKANEKNAKGLLVWAVIFIIYVLIQIFAGMAD